MHACEAKRFLAMANRRAPVDCCARVMPTDVAWSDWRRPNLFAAGRGETVAPPERTPSIPRELLALLAEDGIASTGMPAAGDI